MEDVWCHLQALHHAACVKILFISRKRDEINKQNHRQDFQLKNY